MYNKIIFVAENGTCRAPMAAGILKDMLPGKQIEILPRGLVVLFPEPLNQKAEAVMISNGLPTEGYMSQPLTAEDLEENTLILTMEKKQQQKVLEMFPEAKGIEVYVLTEYVGDELEIADPYGGTRQMYGLCYEMLSSSIRKFVNMLNEGE